MPTLPTMPAPAATLKKNAHFRWLMRGAVVSSIGDQLTVVALPLLVLQAGGDAPALGVVLALMGFPRALLLLLGGALVDRLAPERVLMASKLVNALLLALLALLALHARASVVWTFEPLGSVVLHLTPRVTLLLIDVLACCLGLAQAFGIPAGTALLPNALPASLLDGANGILMGVRQLALLAGPLLAAMLVATSRHGLALAFAIDCISFIVSAWTLAQVSLDRRAAAAPQPVLRAIGAGLRMVWDDLPMRWCFLYWTLVSACIGGAMQVALPVLASSDITAAYHGGASLGLFMGSNGAGMLLGMAGATLGGKRLRVARFGSMVLLLDGAAGVLVASLGLVQQAWLVALLLLGLGTLSGYLQITVYGWIQRRVPLAMMGRAMGMFMFILVGLAPLSALSAAWLLTWVALPALFLAAGALLTALAAAAWLFTPLRHVAQRSV